MRFTSRLVFSPAQQATQTSLNNPDFSLFTDTVIDPDGSLGWETILDTSADFLILDFPCGYFFINLFGGSNGGDVIFENTALLQGGLSYNLEMHGVAGGTDLLVAYDAYVNGVAQGIGGVITFDNGTAGGCDDPFQERNVALDASMIGNFKIRFSYTTAVFDSYGIKYIEVSPQ